MDNNLLKKTFQRIEMYIDEIQNSENYLNENNSPAEILEKIDIAIKNEENTNILAFWVRIRETLEI